MDGGHKISWNICGKEQLFPFSSFDEMDLNITLCNMLQIGFLVEINDKITNVGSW